MLLKSMKKQSAAETDVLWRELKLINSPQQLNRTEGSELQVLKMQNQKFSIKATDTTGYNWTTALGEFQESLDASQHRSCGEISVRLRAHKVWKANRGREVREAIKLMQTHKAPRPHRFSVKLYSWRPSIHNTQSLPTLSDVSRKCRGSQNEKWGQPSSAKINRLLWVLYWSILSEGKKVFYFFSMVPRRAIPVLPQFIWSK